MHRNTLACEGSPVFGLAGPTVRLAGATALVGNRLVHEGLHISVGDMVFAGEALGRVSACCSENGVLYAIVEEVLFDQRLTEHSSIWQRPTSASLKVWPTAGLDLAVAWTKGDRMTVLRL